ncbi:MAG: hypothetical protein WDO74_31750 [Pseudomonadota bacterium]
MAAGLQVQCDLAERMDDLKRLRECADAMTRETPKDPKLLVYQWGVAMKEEDYQRAQTLIDSARKNALQARRDRDDGARPPVSRARWSGGLRAHFSATRRCLA